jgi:hypothetical protein
MSDSRKFAVVTGGAHRWALADDEAATLEEPYTNQGPSWF